MAQAAAGNHAERGSSVAIPDPELIIAEQSHRAAAAPHRRGPRFSHCHAAQQIARRGIALRRCDRTGHRRQ